MAEATPAAPADVPAVTLYGFPESTFVRTARMALAEKGLAYVLERVRAGTPDLRALHPFARVPVLRHGDLVLYETAAIVRYVDEAFEGPPLQPPDAAGRAQMEKWISIVLSYMDPIATRRVLMERLVAPQMGRRANEAVVREALPAADRQLSVLEAELSERAFLAGDGLSLADLFVYPIVFYIGYLPEGRSMLGGREAIGRWRARIEQRPSCTETAPEMRKMR